MSDLVLAITGASGAIYSVRLLEVLLAAGRNVQLTISPSAVLVLRKELGLEVSLDRFELSQLLPADSQLAEDSALRSLRSAAPGFTFDHSSILSETTRGAVSYHHHSDFRAGIASGSSRPPAWSFVPARWNARRHRARVVAEPDPPCRRCASQGATQADPRAARNSPGVDPARQHEADRRRPADDPPRHARLLSRAKVDPRSGRLRRGPHLRPSRNRPQPHAAMGDTVTAGRAGSRSAEVARFPVRVYHFLTSSNSPALNRFQ